MKYKVEKTLSDRVVIAKIRLNDECKNGHQDFAITGEVYEKGKPRTDRYMISGGCCHDDIIRAFPEFKLFIDLHLSDYNGSPMYPEANGWYYCRRGEYDVLQRMMRCTDEQLGVLKSAKDKKHFHYLLQTSGIIEMWKEEANLGIVEMERLTGEQFVNTSTRSQFTPLTEDDLNEMKKLIATGYYSDSKAEERFIASVQEKNEKIISEAKAKAERKINFIKWEVSLKEWVSQNNLPLDSFYYSDNKSEMLFNWIESIGTQITKERLERVFLIPKNNEFIVNNKLSVAINVNGSKLIYDIDKKSF